MNTDTQLEYAPIPETYNDAINAAIAFKDESRRYKAHADKLAEALRELTGMVERYKDAELRMERIASYYNALDVLDAYEAAQG